MIAIPAMFALSGTRRVRLVLLAIGVFYWVMIGFRLHVGMDWNNYLILYQFHHRSGFAILNNYYDPSYAFLNWIAGKLGGGYILVNAVCALVFCWGLFSVAARSDEPFLAVVVATPLLVVALAMSGARQSIALGFIYYLFAAWDQRSTLVKIALVVIAATFHSSAIFILIFVALGSNASNVVRVGSAAVMGALILGFMIYRPLAFEAYGARYVFAGAIKQNAPGAIVQVGMVAAAGLIYLILRRSFQQIGRYNSLYQNLAIASLAALPAIAISSVGSYRFALYFWPMAMHVWSTLPSLIRSGVARALYRIVAVAASIAVLIGWLVFANNSWAWVPYDNWLIHPHAGLFRRGAHDTLD
jgi:hypothetical protein